MPNIIFNLQYRATQFFKGALPTGAKNINTYESFDYYNRSEACDMSIVEENTDKSFNYYAYRVGSTGCFNEEGVVSKESMKEKMEKYKPEIMYRAVFSFEDDFATKTGIKDKANIQKLIQKTMKKNLKLMGFDSNNVEWMAFYHTNTKHPHVHVNFYEKQRRKKLFMLSKDKLKKVKSNVVSLMDLNVNMYIDRDEIKANLLKNAKDLNLSDNLKDMLKNTANDKKGSFDIDTDVLKEFERLNSLLPTTGSMKFNSANLKDYRIDILKVVNLMKKNDKIANLLSELNMHLDKEIEEQIIIYGGDKDDKDKIAFKERQLKTVDEKLANLVLSNIKDYRRDCIDDLDREANQGTLKLSKKDENQCHRKIRKERVNKMFHGATTEIARAIQQSAYGQRSLESKAKEVTRKAQEEIRGRSI